MPKPHAVAVSAPPCQGFRTITRDDDEWPTRLNQLACAPEKLWLRGESLLAVQTPVAILGARASTSYGEHVASTLAAELAEAGVTILSGGSYGIEAATIRGALGVGGSVVCLQASGIDAPYPRANTALLEAVTERGTVLTGHEPGVTPTRSLLQDRSRQLAAMASVVIVVEAAARSGALLSVAQAHELGTPVLAVPGPVTSAVSAAPHDLIRNGIARLATRAADVLTVLDQKVI